MKDHFLSATCRIVCAYISLAGWSVLAVAQQTGAISGRVLGEDGAGLPNATVMLTEVSINRGGTITGRRASTTTDDEGKFRFTDLAPRVYTVAALATKGLVFKPVPASERAFRSQYRVGDNVTITMIRGGVITGRVTTQDGEPMIGVSVTAVMVKDFEGAPVQQFGGRARSTDDRGVYRLFGLAPGTYVVLARTNSYASYLSPYDGYAATYSPSSPRETAAEVTVSSGGEVAGIDIRYRGERGQIVSGTVAGGGETSQPFGVTVTLHSIPSGFVIGSAPIRPSEGPGGFAIYGVPDGEYEIVARRGNYNGEEGLVSAPRSLTVKGADVGGVELRLAPLASVSGKIVVEAPAACESKRKSSLGEALVAVRRDERGAAGATHFITFPPDGSVNDKGEFAINNLDATRYFLEPRLPDDNWYLKSITAPSKGGTAAKATANIDLAGNGMLLKPGEKLTGLTVTVGQGAASLAGKVTAAEGMRLPSRLRVHLMPAEATSANEVLRYAETLAQGDGSFTFRNLAPGKYWLSARAVPGDEPSDPPALPSAWDANERAKLRKEAEAMKVEVELKACQRVSDQMIKYSFK